ncbi:uncharacterized protein BO80DRAFT_256525 [Aspergillus ibericus CBS 121593]|uniref:Uncharacterized protein n=1 Tax=Aspergillus ibericus CBS 121593 TaxID=1448316 RepID=A0A395HAD1_9EURO|nr:hypothetical protein BO80DRAFT_256525 [Aspergillus ibericus CBS 121593]RAL04115.1 hypothetical protein BO80DRAFT_256525 [Aspergillus ibericus CBS 121593]
MQDSHKIHIYWKILNAGIRRLREEFSKAILNSLWYDKRDVSRHRHSPLIALTEEDPTRGKLPIKENCSISLQSRSVRRPKATRRRGKGWTTVVAGSVKAFRCMERKEKKRKDRRGRPLFIAVVRHVRRVPVSLDGARHQGPPRLAGGPSGTRAPRLPRPSFIQSLLAIYVQN